MMSSGDSPRAALGGRSVVLVAMAAFAVAVYTLYPGWYSFDSAYQLHQARTGDFASIQPPAMPLAWAALLAFGLPPGALLVVHLAALFAGAALLGLSMARARGVAAPLVLLWPPFLVVLGHLWIDVSMAAALLLAAGWIAWTRATGRAALGWWAAIPLAYAIGPRHNALFAVPPLLFLLLPWPRKALARAVVAVGLTLAAFGAWTAVARMVAVPVPVWSVIAIWDLAAVSVESGEMLLPAGVRGPGLTVEELRPLVNAHSVTGLLTGTSSGINAGLITPLAEEAKRELMRRWVRLPFTHGMAWLRHRLAVTASLFGPQPPGRAEAEFIQPIVTAYGDNPPIRRNETTANELLLRAARALHHTLLCAPIVYFALSIVAVGIAARPRFTGDRMLVGALALGTWLYAAPLVVLAPATEWRYALWPMVSAVVALLLALGSRGYGQRFQAARTGETPR